MIKLIPRIALLSLSLTLLSTLAWGQDVPAVNAPVSYQGFQLPSTLGTLSYALNTSEIFRTGYYNSGNVWSTLVSGDLAFLSSSVTRPFSMVYAGGFSTATSQSTSFFQNLALSQVFKTRNFNLILSDSVSYLPETASSGLSGVPGSGDVGIPSPGGGSQEILTSRGQRVGNTASASLDHPFTASTSIRGSGSYFIQRTLSGSAGGLDTNDISAQAGMNHRIDARTNVNAAYTFSKFEFPSSDYSFTSQGINVGFTRRVTRQLSFDASLGPNRSSNSGPNTGTGSNSTINLSVNTGLAYDGEVTSYTLRYSRGVQGGSGILQGSTTDDLVFQANRALGPIWHLSASGGYTHNKTLDIIAVAPTSVQTVHANLQLSRALARAFSGSLTYSILRQSIQGTAATTNAFAGVSNVIAVGLSYSPRQLHLGHK